MQTNAVLTRHNICVFRYAVANVLCAWRALKLCTKCFNANKFLLPICSSEGNTSLRPRRIFTKEIHCYFLCIFFAFYFLFGCTSISGFTNNLLVHFILMILFWSSFNVFKVHFHWTESLDRDTVFLVPILWSRWYLSLGCCFSISFEFCRLPVRIEKKKNNNSNEIKKNAKLIVYFINLLEFQKRWKMRWQAFYVYFMARSESIICVTKSKRMFLLFNF